MELTEEQKKKLKALQKSSAKRGALMGLKTVFTLFVANFFIIALDASMAHSQSFIFISSMVTAFFVFSNLGRETKKEHDRIKLEVKNILENK